LRILYREITDFSAFNAFKGVNILTVVLFFSVLVALWAYYIF